MALQHVIGLDHVVVSVRDLDKAAAAWRALGFTVSPRGTHSPHMGSANYTIMFGEDYMELLGVLTPTEHNAAMREWLAEQEGIERAAFTALDAAAGVAELQAKGIAAIGPIAFGRPVELPDGTIAEARFNVMRWPVGLRPGGLRIFACQHLTRENVWVPSLQSHANGAARILRLEMLTGDPRAAAAEMAALIVQSPRQDADGAWVVPTGGDRADLVFLDRAILAARHPGISLEGLPEEGAAALVLGTRDYPGAARALGVSADGAVAVPAGRATGVLLRFLAI
ncbi:VOC family protein [Roseococcus sp. SDR]|uniref:VOC family protein n=1 Tax=Roseococcus sp. SDR TaxID=2835532 RepID=UPI001BCFC741|nr:VOC family protein [Roseococcus sp. SDR]MBS7788760.1 VOC family protein [Roseococcus sp. SDR]MBV1844074.1 VOC family protein [Roseococcus sp. SDR]